MNYNKKLNLILIIIGVVIFFVFSAPLVAGILNIGNIFGILVGTIMILFGFFLDKINKMIRITMQNKFYKVVLYFVISIICIGLVFFNIALISVIKNSTTNATNENVIIVLGCSVYGSEPSKSLLARVNEAYKYLEKNENAIAILSGGQGKNENISESQCMYDILISKGIDKERLFKEEKSSNTEENLKFSKEVIDQNNFGYDIAVVTDGYHLKRATMEGEKIGLNVKRIGTKSGFWSIPTYFVRESFGVLRELIK